jgi:hypothetical protein
MDKLLKKLNINEEFTREIRGIKFDKVKQNVYPKSGFNFMADLLHLPQTKYRYRYLFVIVDLWSNAFDIEPIRTKTPEDVLKALKIFNRKKSNTFNSFTDELLWFWRST